MDGWATLIGTAAAVCTTASYVPQVRKTWQTGETRDLSLRMLITLAVGLTLWCLYGIARSDPVIVVANGASLAMLAALLYWKLRDQRHGTTD
ncbi:SemiSWEET transporter [Hyphomicrobium sp.]|uniref:SemiSWEET family sugar transporter n=1 Tax=Hyphomicrobium sp. TaxID=82 RepID=UPI0025C5DADA|nr:SemiSWEET transporter [Hyphomicrobium sp.]MCC7251811.1 SemiSWEET transporter [Hyphomicrobium sp.]